MTGFHPGLFAIYATGVVVAVALHTPIDRNARAEDVAVGLLWPLWVPLVAIRFLKIGLRLWYKAAVDLFRRWE